MTAAAHQAAESWVQDHDATIDAASRLARFVREGGDLHELLGRLCDTAPRQMIRAVVDMEAGSEPVVRRRLTGATSPNRAMVLAYSELDTSDGSAS